MKPKTVKELRAEAKALGVPRYSKMRKAELLEAIAAHIEYDPADDSAKCYDLAINVMRNKLAKFRQERIGDCWLIHGDCREVLPLLPKVDAVVTDPPYGVNLGDHAAAKEKRKGWLSVSGYESYEDTPENLVKIVVPAVEKALALAKRGLVFCADKNIHLFPRPSNVGGIFLPAPCGRNAWGFNSLMHCLLYGVAPNIHLGARPTAVASTETAEKNGHPTPKPLGWMKWAVNLASLPGETVLDPFIGSGTTGVACVKLGRKFIGIEIEERYFNIACRRIEEAYRQPDLFVSAPAPKAEQFVLADL